MLIDYLLHCKDTFFMGITIKKARKNNKVDGHFLPFSKKDGIIYPNENKKLAAYNFNLYICTIRF